MIVHTVRNIIVLYDKLKTLLGQCPQCSQELHMENHFEISWSISCIRSRYLVRSLIGMFLLLFCVVDLETSNGLMPAVDKLMMQNWLLSSSIGKVVASHAEGCKVARSNPGCGGATPIYTMHEALSEYCPWGWGVRPANWIYRLWRHCP